MKVMFSIKPQYVERILSGDKIYEFRRRVFKRTDVDTLVIYSTLPQGAVVAEASIEGILASTPLDIWNRTHRQGGIGKDKFMEYFKGTSSAFAICLGTVRCFEQPIPLKDYSDKIDRPPQSSAYLD